LAEVLGVTTVAIDGCRFTNAGKKAARTDELADHLARRYPGVFSQHEHATDTLIRLLTDPVAAPSRADAYSMAFHRLVETIPAAARG
jgi:hypothetical protein